MPTHRLLPPSSGPFLTCTVNGRQYVGTPGTAYDVPDFDSGGLQANGWSFIAYSGPTSARPTSPVGNPPLRAGVRYYDTMLGFLLTFDGASWRDETGVAR